MFIGAIAPIKDRVKGSRVNKPGSASGSGKIVFSDATNKSIRSILMIINDISMIILKRLDVFMSILNNMILQR